MGNSASESIDHSFKRLRLSQTQKLSLPSPSCSSPKRKVPLSKSAEPTGTLDNETINQCNDQLPILDHHSINYLLLSTYFSLKISESIINKEANLNTLSDDEILCLMKACRTTTAFNDKNISENDISYEDIEVHFNYEKMIPELSNEELIEYVKNAFANDTHQ